MAVIKAANVVMQAFRPSHLFAVTVVSDPFAPYYDTCQRIVIDGITDMNEGVNYNLDSMTLHRSST
ncbi:hypothetical protein GI364_23420 [Alicyclobacillus sp. SO9]|nr:hypothetical protein GI364_23420 [Alicyclobacillus sp. SO9]